MRVLVEGSGGAAGWPEPGCRCASCLLKESIRVRSTILIDGLVRLGVGAADGGRADGGRADGGRADGGRADGGIADGGTRSGGSRTATGCGGWRMRGGPRG